MSNFNKSKTKSNKSMASEKKWISLNVGGTYFMTSRSTLTKNTPPNSPLYRISSNSTNIDWDRDEKGAYMIDRDPVFFQPILNFLRHGRLIMNRDIPEEGILMEAEYFNLPELVKIIKVRLGNRQRWFRAYSQCKHSAPTPPLNINPMHVQQFSGKSLHGPVPCGAYISQGQNSSTQNDIPDSRAQPFLGSNLKQVFNNQFSCQHQQARIPSSASMSSLINQQEYLTSYVNNILEDDMTQA